MARKFSSKRTSWKFYFDRRDKAAREGRHLPTAEDLALGMSFFNNDILQDAQTWAERLLLRLKTHPERESCTEVSDALKRLTVNPDMEDFTFAASVLFHRAPPEGRWLPREEARLRCMVYAAARGELSAVSFQSAYIARSLNFEDNPYELAQASITMLLGLAVYAHEEVGRPFWRAGENSTDFLGPGMELWKTFEKLKAAHEQGNKTRAGQVDSLQNERGTGAAVDPLADDEGKVVFSYIGNEKGTEDQKVTKQFKHMLGKPLPLVRMQNLKPARTQLRSEFPHALDVIDILLNDLATRRYLALRPTILVGIPGCGKTTFAMRLAEILSLPFQLFPCAGVHDSRFAGAARAWTTGEPSMPVSLIASKGVANPMIILDETEKAGGGRHNGDFLEAILPMLEPRSAAKYFDGYLQADVDLSGVIFLGTANDPSRLPQPLRDRCRILSFPTPDRAQLPELVSGLIVGIAKDRGVDPRWITPFSGDELEALAAAWPGGSLRALQRLIEGVLKAREYEVECH